MLVAIAIAGRRLALAAFGVEGRVGFEPTTPGLKVRGPCAEPLTQFPPAATRTRVRIDEASPDDLPEKQEAAPWRPPLRIRCDVRWGVERESGIEPPSPAWKAGALPLSYSRLLSGMVEAVCIDLGQRRVVGITPRGPVQQAFAALSPGQEDGSFLIHQGKWNGSPKAPVHARTWWRRGRIRVRLRCQLANLFSFSDGLVV